MDTNKTLFLQPRISEKTYSLAQTRNTYVFEVPTGANKHVIAYAVATQFDVTIEDVNITNVKGKAKRTVRKGGRAVTGKRSDFKKAYVTLKAGQSLPFFETEETADEGAKGKVKADKKEKK